MIATLFFCLGLSCLSSKNASEVKPPTPVNAPTPQPTAPMLTQHDQLQNHIGQTVQIKGLVRRMKAGTALEIDGARVWCSNADLSDVANQHIVATGTLQQGTSPMQSFPKATVNDAGEWTQGVATPDLLTPTPDPLFPDVPSTGELPQEEKGDQDQKDAPPTAWTLTISSYEVTQP